MRILDRRRAPVLALVTMVATTGACSGSAPRGAPMPPTPAVRNVTLSEYHFSYDTSVPAGRVAFRFTNDGKVQHRPILLPLDDDVPPIDVQLHGSERKVVPPFAGLRMRDPGQTGTFAVDLAPNHRYAFICYAIAADGQVHALKGMSSEFRTGPATSPLHK